MITKEFITVKLNELHPYENNPRINDNAVSHVKASIEQCENLDPIEIDENGVILSGHTRLLALQELGYTETEVVRISGLDEDQKRKYRILANKTNEIADWDFDKLAVELDGLDFDGFDFGFDSLERLEIQENENQQIAEDDFDEEPPVEPKSKLGDIYQLGRHRLMCGDSTKAEDIKTLIGDNKIQLVLTDPPYGISVVQGNQISGGSATHFGKVGGGNIVKSSTYMAIKGDETTDTAKLNYSILKDVSDNQIIFGGNYFTDFLPPKACWCVWDKQNTGNFADCEMAWTSFDKGAKLYHWLWNGLCRKGDRSVEGVSRVHPTQKPVGMLADILKDFSEKGNNILDCFGGSGSTLMACEQTERNCYMMEYEPHYIDVIIARWEKFTGMKATKLN